VTISWPDGQTGSNGHDGWLHGLKSSQNPFSWRLANPAALLVVVGEFVTHTVPHEVHVALGRFNAKLEPIRYLLQGETAAKRQPFVNELETLQRRAMGQPSATLLQVVHRRSFGKQDMHQSLA
jgi:hypothetical protein